MKNNLLIVAVFFVANIFAPASASVPLVNQNKENKK